MLRKVMFGILWFVALNIAFGSLAAAPYFLGSFTFDAGAGTEMSSELQRRDSGSVEFLAFVIALVGTALGILPGTRRQAIEPNRLIVSPTRSAAAKTTSSDRYSSDLSEITPFAGVDATAIGNR